MLKAGLSLPFRGLTRDGVWAADHGARHDTGQPRLPHVGHLPCRRAERSSAFRLHN